MEAGSRYEAGLAIGADGFSVRSTFASSVLMLGLAGGFSVAPVLIWALAARGLL